MRVLLKKRSSTKAERVFSEILKRNHIPFKYKVIVDGKEIDFIIAMYAIEIDGHLQDSTRNQWIFSKGYTPIHYTNEAVLKNRSAVEEDIRLKYGISSKTS